MNYIIWDFNGTVFNDVEAGIKSANTLLSRRGLKTMKCIEEYHAIFGFPIIDYYKRLGFNFEKDLYEDLAVEWLKEYLINVENAALQFGIKETLEHFRSIGINQVILSMCESSLLNRQLKTLGVADYFDEILGLDNIYAVSKLDIAKKWAKNKNLKKAVLIGDTVHDFQTATEIGSNCILLANGHQSREILEKCNVPVYDNALFWCF